MKALVLNNVFAPFGRGSGSETISGHIANGLRKHGIQSTVLSLCMPFKRPDKTSEVIFWPSFFPFLGKLPVFLRLLWHIFEFFNLAKMLRFYFLIFNFKPDLVVLNNTMGFGKGLYLILRLKKIKTVQILHDIQFVDPSGQLFWGEEKKYERFVYRFYAFLNRYFLKRLDLVVSPSRWLLDFYREKGLFIGQRARVVRNPVEENFFRIKKKDCSSTFTILYVGQIAGFKGLASALEASLALGVGFVLVGAGAGLTSYRARYRSDKIKFLGYKKPAQLPEIYESADAVILPSLCYENCPTSLLEAVAAGLPFLCAGLGGAGEIARSFNGLVFKPGDQADIADKIVFLKKNYPRFFCQAQRQRCQIAEPTDYAEALIKNIL